MLKMRRPRIAPDIRDFWIKVKPETYRQVIDLQATDEEGRYLHWDDLFHRAPPEGLTRENWWLGMRTARAKAAISTPFTAKDGTIFNFKIGRAHV